MLTFMVRGIFTKLEFPYAQFPTRGVTAYKLFPIVWDAVRNSEECGLKVMVITCDGESPNRKFFKMHKAAKTADEVVYNDLYHHHLSDRIRLYILEREELCMTAIRFHLYPATIARVLNTVGP